MVYFPITLIDSCFFMHFDRGQFDLATNSQSVHFVTKVGILGRGITLIHPYSRNNSDYHRVDLFFLLFLQQNSKGNNSEVEMTLTFNTSPNLTWFWAGKIRLHNKRKINQVFVVRLIPELLLFLLENTGQWDYIGLNQGALWDLRRRFTQYSRGVRISNRISFELFKSAKCVKLTISFKASMIPTSCARKTHSPNVIFKLSCSMRYSFCTYWPQ